MITQLSACPQFVASGNSMWAQYAAPSLLQNIGESRNAGATAWSSAEDCLSMAIWTPADVSATSKLPVALFVTGGGGTTGGIDVPSQLPSQWVSRSQEHIVVTINYRVNIFGSRSHIVLSCHARSLTTIHLYSSEIEGFERERDLVVAARCEGRGRVCVREH